MKLLSLLDPQRSMVKVGEEELWFKKLNWEELTGFQEFAEKMDLEEGKSENESTINLCKHILDKYVTDEDGDKVIDSKDVKRLPVDFCIKLVNRFVDRIKAPEQSEIKKN